MIGIEKIKYTLGDIKINNYDRATTLDTTKDLIENKIGMEFVARMQPDQETSDLAFDAAKKIFIDEPSAKNNLECLIVITQNPDGFGLPHTSAILHGKLGLKESVACFDISLGCSGYVYGLSIIKSFMKSNNMTRGLLVSADPYSKILDENDRNTTLIFGDAASATLISNQHIWNIGKFDFGTDGSKKDSLKISVDRKLVMNGRAVFNFSAKEVPKSIERTLDLNNMTMDKIDQIVLHQGSRFIVETIARRLDESKRIRFYASQYGNTVSSSIPIILADHILSKNKNIIISGFGVGLSLATTILSRQEIFDDN